MEVDKRLWMFARANFCLREACGKDFTIGIKFTVTHEIDDDELRSI